MTTATKPVSTSAFSPHAAGSPGTTAPTEALVPARQVFYDLVRKLRRTAAQRQISAITTVSARSARSPLRSLTAPTAILTTMMAIKRTGDGICSAIPAQSGGAWLALSTVAAVLTPQIDRKRPEHLP